MDKGVKQAGYEAIQHTKRFSIATKVEFARKNVLFQNTRKTQLKRLTREEF